MAKLKLYLLIESDEAAARTVHQVAVFGHHVELVAGGDTVHEFEIPDDVEAFAVVADRWPHPDAHLLTALADETGALALALCIGSAGGAIAVGEISVDQAAEQIRAFFPDVPLDALARELEAAAAGYVEALNARAAAALVGAANDDAYMQPKASAEISPARSSVPPGGTDVDQVDVLEWTGKGWRPRAFAAPASKHTTEA